MAVSGVGGGASSAAQMLATGGKSKSDGVADFISYMNETPAQRFQDNWLKQHGITKQQFDAMTPAQKKALTDQMKQEIEQKLKQNAQDPNAKPAIPNLL